ncbi:PQQ-binding-like beta-propeller repeat protein [Actinoplanes sp. NPDC051633]|uniref:outer membrane protein assembly factor BamB family protein n=1 Tax=Actinoplanes sp. NPDC051633 TaxID=3155670 RepID=UPI003443178C
MAVIELDLDAPPEPPAELPAHRYRWAALAAVAALLLTLGGAAPAVSVLWRPLGTIPLDGQGWWTVAGDRVYTLNDAEVQAWRVSATSLARDWAVTLPGAQATADARIYIGGRLIVTGDALVAQTSDFTASVLDPESGRLRWRSPSPVEQVMHGVGLSRRTTFRPGTEYDQDSGDPGELYVSDDGIPHIEPPMRTDLRGTDLNTGRELWNLRAAGSVFTTSAGGVVLMIASDRIALIDPRTGAIRQERPVKGLTWGRTIGDLVLVRQGDRMLAYDAHTLEPRWQAPGGLPDDDADVGYCENLVCRPTDDGMEVLDEATGAVRWRAAPKASLRGSGDDVLESDTLTQTPWRLLDRRTGELRTSLAHWQTVVQGDGMILSRWEAGAGSRVFAVARNGAVQPLGRADPGSQDCRGNEPIVSCRNGNGIDFFAYR